jgi:DNA-directed RNA polymerase subunit RPC12/RpoP
MDNLRPSDDLLTLAPFSVTCAECQRQVDEDEAQAQRWGYWSVVQGELYPYCPECAERRFAA